ncbi:MAG: GNAT family N-acetyltransferase [Planctomycetota bacterium]
MKTASTLRLLRPDELDAAHLSVWSALRRSCASLESPFFAPDYLRAVAAEHAGVELGVAEQDGEPVAFLPFQRLGRRHGAPVGRRLCDFNGIIATPEVDLAVPEIVSACGLSVWRFDHAPVEQQALRPYHRRVSRSPLLDLSDGFDAYARAQRAGGSALIPQIQRKARKAAREVGPLRFEWQTDEPEVLAALLRWKGQQRRRTDTVDPMQAPAARALVERLWHTDTTELGGVLSALWIGDELAAAHFGLRSDTVLHFWFPGYGDGLARYSPGLILLLELARGAAARGLQRLDLGKGEERYKRQLMTGEVALAEGQVAVGALHQAWGEVRYGALAVARSRPMRGAVRVSKRAVRRALYALGRLKTGG